MARPRTKVKRDRKESRAISLANLKPGVALHGEVKERHHITVTPTAWKLLKAIANDLGLSVSELNEGIGRGKLKVSVTS